MSSIFIPSTEHAYSRIWIPEVGANACSTSTGECAIVHHNTHLIIPADSEESRTVHVYRILADDAGILTLHEPVKMVMDGALPGDARTGTVLSYYEPDDAFKCCIYSGGMFNIMQAKKIDGVWWHWVISPTPQAVDGSDVVVHCHESKQEICLHYQMEVSRVSTAAILDEIEKFKQSRKRPSESEDPGQKRPRIEA